MKIHKFIYFVILVPFFISCSSLPKESQNDLDIHKFEDVHLRQTKSQISQILGNPSEIRSIQDSELWIYNDHDEYGTQRGSIAFDSKSQVVKSITIIPRSREPESHLDFVLKKYSAANFQKFPLQKCTRDYFPTSLFYISEDAGIVIETNTRINNVESYGVTTPESAADLVEKIKSCKR